MQKFLQSQELQRHQLLYGKLDSQPAPPLPPEKRSYFLSNPSSVGQTHEYASLEDNMGDATHRQHRRQTTSSRLGLRSSEGKIVEVQGGHIVRSVGRKDRHSKVCTAKGPRDRRAGSLPTPPFSSTMCKTALATTAPAKQLIGSSKKAKAAIDELDELPPWNPTTGSAANSNMEQEDHATQHKQQEENTSHQQQQRQHFAIVDAIAGPSSRRPMSMLGNENALQVQQLQMNNSKNPSGSNSQSFLPSSLDSDAIADTIKTFFPTDGWGQSSSTAMQFQSLPNPELLSRTSSHSQDLRLSLQSFHDPMLLHQNPQSQHHQNPTNQTDESQAQVQAQAQAIFPGTAAMGFDVSGWSENQPSAADIGRFQRMAAWYASGDSTATSGGGGAFMFNSPATPPLLQSLFGQSHFFSRRGPLQSSNTLSVRAWMDPAAAAVTIAAAATDAHQLQHRHHHHQTVPIHPSSFAGIGFACGAGGFSSFQIPPLIQGEEEEHDVISVNPSSASRH